MTGSYIWLKPKSNIDNNPFRALNDPFTTNAIEDCILSTIFYFIIIPIFLLLSLAGIYIFYRN